VGVAVVEVEVGAAVVRMAVEVIVVEVDGGGSE
jgi:hypothetical protein